MSQLTSDGTENSSACCMAGHLARTLQLSGGQETLQKNDSAMCSASLLRYYTASTSIDLVKKAQQNDQINTKENSLSQYVGSETIFLIAREKN